MTREEANEILEDWNLCHYTPSREAAEVVISALDPLEIISALRPVSREQVEKVWRGEWMFKPFYKGTSRGAIECQECKGAFEGSVEFNFCPNCGAPMTDEAVDMMLERIKKMEETGNGLG